MERKIFRLVLTLLVLLSACSADPGYKAYREYARAHLYNLKWVDDAGNEYRQADYPVDYDTLPDFASIQDTAARKQAFSTICFPPYSIAMPLIESVPCCWVDWRFACSMTCR
ncbi:MAG: hypothetical protein AAGI24_10550 [Pseudomonadota bacterium]